MRSVSSASVDVLRRLELRVEDVAHDAVAVDDEGDAAGQEAERRRHAVPLPHRRRPDRRAG